MITKVVHGWRVGGLIAYLMGPGRAQEHVRPRVVASWDGRDAAWQPSQLGEGAFDRDLGPLIRVLRAPAVAAGLPEHDDEGKRGYVWHCSARVAGGDRVLSDAEWAEVARDLLDGAGIAARDDAGGPRWVATRHADDHIHIAVVLVRQDTGRRFWPSHDYPRLREAARGVERRLGLTVTAPADGTAAKAPQRGEIEKSRRQGRVPARVELARAVRAAALGAGGLVEFVTALRTAGHLVEVRRAPSGDPLGYKVSRSGDVTAAGEPVFYSGSKLAPDLSLPRLLRGWESAERGSEAAVPLDAARRRVDAARAVVGSARRGGAEGDARGIAWRRSQCWLLSGSGRRTCARRRRGSTVLHGRRGVPEVGRVRSRPGCGGWRASLSASGGCSACWTSRGRRRSRWPSRCRRWCGRSRTGRRTGAGRIRLSRRPRPRISSTGGRRPAR
ncbi:MAG: relaxase/mobilization nuclease domain-containing protein [Pseudonocardia sp.]